MGQIEWAMWANEQALASGLSGRPRGAVDPHRAQAQGAAAGRGHHQAAAQQPPAPAPGRGPQEAQRGGGGGGGGRGGLPGRPPGQPHPGDRRGRV
ncbi:cytochrome b-245 light chain, partial [Daubentonia madagascariensis]